MRQALVHQLPALTLRFGLTPEDIDNMTYNEVLVYIHAHNQLVKQEQEQAKKLERQARRRR